MNETSQYFELDSDGDKALESAAAAIREGECIVIPTDTVYGIAASAFNAKAVQRLLDAKQRGKDMPPPVLIAEPSMLRAFTSALPRSAVKLADTFWPGALTMVLTAQKALHLKIGETGGTVAVRVPDNESARALLRRTGPLAVSSANVHGQPPATTCREAQDSLGEAVRVYLDGGPTPGLASSTIIDFTRFNGGQIVREGVLEHEELKKVALRLKPMEHAQPPETPELEGAEETPQLDTTPDAAELEAPGDAAEPGQTDTDH